MKLTQLEPPQGLDLPVADSGFHILAKARHILSSPAVWNRNDDRLCEDDLKQKSWSLFCALHQASIDVAGVYLHRSPVMMEARAVVGEVTNGRSFAHSLKDYNNLDSTSYADILRVLEATQKRLQTRAACASAYTYSRSILRPYAIPVPNEARIADNQDVDFLVDEFSRMVQANLIRYLLDMELTHLTVMFHTNGWPHRPQQAGGYGGTAVSRTWMLLESSQTEITGDTFLNAVKRPDIMTFPWRLLSFSIEL